MRKGPEAGESPMVGRPCLRGGRGGGQGWKHHHVKPWAPTEGLPLGVTWLDLPYEEARGSGKYNQSEGRRF